jgi:hypothetical protein
VFTEKLAGRNSERPVEEGKTGIAPASPHESPGYTAEGISAPQALDVPLAEEIFEADKDKTSAIPFETIAEAKREEESTEEILNIYNNNNNKGPEEPALPPPFPKSVVKTTRGRVIGEYYYDPKAYKNKRHYIFNSRFFLQQLGWGLNVLQGHADQTLYTELLQMIQDAYKRISENRMMHFEISTSEILNERTLKELWQSMKTKDFAEAGRFCKRLNAKIDLLRSNYHAMLKEQMGRFSI